MKTTKLALTIIALMALSQVAMAQTSGTIALSGSVPATFTITNTSNGSITLTPVSFTGLLPIGSTNTLVTDTGVVARLRSNQAFKLQAQVTTPLAHGAGPGDDFGDPITVSDIGFGIRTFVNTGANVVNTGSRTDIITQKFDYTGGFPTGSGGLITFDGTTVASGSLNHINAAPTTILTGQRISKRGNISTTDNFLVVTFGFCILPQFFTPDANFTATITLTIGSNP